MKEIKGDRGRRFTPLGAVPALPPEEELLMI
jgi:hypothetical protein